MKVILIAVVLSLAGARAVAQEVPAGCMIGYKPGLNGVPRFEDFPTKVSSAKPVPPKITSKDAREFRTMIRDGAKGGVNFAGHFTIVGWGCGAECLDWAVVDQIKGRIYIIPKLRNIITSYHIDVEKFDDKSLNQEFNSLRFRKDSELLIIQGAPQENLKREGLIFLRWTGRDFVKIGFLKPPRACSY